MGKMVSEKYARKYYELGKKWGTYDKYFEEATEEAMNMDGWEAMAAFKAGARGYEFKIEEWERYGEMRVANDGYVNRSWNYADNTPEDGVSVATPEWEKTISGMFIIAGAEKKIKVRGIQVGIGSDGEPAILPIR